MDNRSLPMVRPKTLVVESKLISLAGINWLKTCQVVTFMLETLVNLVTPILECAGM